jgi:hypothetical protein
MHHNHKKDYKRYCEKSRIFVDVTPSGIGDISSAPDMFLLP